MNRLRWIGLSLVSTILTIVCFWGATYFYRLAISAPYELVRDMPDLLKATQREFNVSRVLAILAAVFFLSSLACILGTFFHNPKPKSPV